MPITKTKLLIIVSALLIAQAGLIAVYFDFFSSVQEVKKSPNYGDFVVHRSYFQNQDFYDEAYENVELQVVKPDAKVYGAIVPHHLIVKDKIATFFEGLKDYDYQTVILIGPNHFNAGDSNILLSQAKWQTPYGEIYPALDYDNELDNKIAIEEDPFINEHSISGLVPFIKKSLPQAKILPIMLKSQTTAAEASELAQILKNIVDPDKTLVIASVDFSHYQPTNVADFHDLRSNAVIQNFDYDRIYDLEIDSSPAIYSLLKYLEAVKAQSSQLVFSTNSGRLINKQNEPTTSHSFFYFTKGEKNLTQVYNLLFFGDIMLNRNVAEKIKANGFDYLLSKLAGEERRFFQGLDLIGANLEGAVTTDGKHYEPEIANDFSFLPDYIRGLKGYGFNFFNIANNHLSDQGLEGIAETKNNLTNLNLDYVGCVDAMVDDCSYKIITLDNLKIGMIGLSMVNDDLEFDKVQKIIEKLKNETDQIIVNIHWGEEYNHQFNSKQQTLAHKLVDYGADIIIGHHPHVVQGMETYNNKPIFYSLGNFIFDQYFSADTQQGLAVGLSLEFDEQNNQISSYDIFLTPFNSSVSQPRLLTETEGKQFYDDFSSWSVISENDSEELASGRLELVQ